MSYRYVCRCCGMKIAEIDHAMVTEGRLGFDSLTPEERQSIISRERGGDTVVRVLCDYCKDAFDQHPELTLVGNPLQ
ncbi:anti-sigma-F factor Fin family protein [Brevibacillus sp. SYP-B805]|uniref:anti-sigma-F factor Fin n=1 Tax=Brevibacillus sp. SYP-B805 TaxID=1578199 RepID=UPI0013EB89E3|nr:anti-sigma-F factor Fin [Brevibacillus sp. SYP-B805]NGQ96478.1 anti-sigma-F factor Fin family protein [Brevibacillus sp. SYP-B805]